MTRRAPVLLSVLLLTSLVAVAPIADAGLLSPILGSKQSGEVLVGFKGPVNTLAITLLGGTVLRTIDEIGVAQVYTSDVTTFLAKIVSVLGVAFAETNDGVRLSGAWNGVSWSASSWDASSWDASSWDASSWDASSWDASSWDASSWDASSWDASSWDASSWDASSWDASSWDASSWDASSWDASSWDGSSMDPGYPSQWGLGAANFVDAWVTERGSGHVAVCVLDTGVDAKHPDLRPHLLKPQTAMRGGTTTSDDVGHGTHVAGILAAAGGNGKGIMGAASEPVLSVKIMDARGGTEADLAEGLTMCVAGGARIASMSLHIDKHSPTVQRAVEYAQSRGLLLVAATGNDGASSVRYPAAYPGVLAVGAHDASGAAPAFSNGGTRLDLVAPGDHVVGTYPGGAYRSGSGTSQAVPFAAAAAALVWERAPAASAATVRGHLLASANDLGPAGWDARTGAGALDAAGALARVG